ncbi:MAG: hypothetical protein WCO93_12870, partial [bacterium]
MEKATDHTAPKLPIRRSTNILSDVRYYFFHRPERKTLVKFNTEEDRHRYSESIMQRVGIEVDQYRLLNIHRIGIEVPSSILFDDLLKWNGDSICWPNHIARVNLQDNKLEHILISLFGKSKERSGFFHGLFSFNFPQLFVLEAIRIQATPTALDTDNARYLLYKCSGGYPIGVFSMYVRSSIPERGESSMSQLFIMVSFNFYGKKTLSKLSFVNKIWEGIHNRVTANVANRFKMLCE